MILLFIHFEISFFLEKLVEYNIIYILEVRLFIFYKFLIKIDWKISWWENEIWEFIIFVYFEEFEDLNNILLNFGFRIILLKN